MNLQLLLNQAKQRVLLAKTDPDRFYWLIIQCTIEGLINREQVAIPVNLNEQKSETVVK